MTAHALDDATARRLVERHLAKAVSSVRREGSAVLVTADSDTWRLTQPPRADMLLDTGEVTIVEAQRHIFGGPARVRGIALLPDGSSHDLGEAKGIEAFVRDLPAPPDPLALAQLVIRYRGPALIGTWPSQLVATADDLQPSLRSAMPAEPVGVHVERDDGGYTVEATTQSQDLSAEGSVTLVLHRWRITLTPDRELRVVVTLEATAPASDPMGS